MTTREKALAWTKVLREEVAGAERILADLRSQLDAAEDELEAIEAENDAAADELHAARADPRQIGLPL